MPTTALLLEERFADHRNPPGHPECPERIRALLPLLATTDPERTLRISPRAATREELLRVHTAGHVDLVEASRTRDFTFFDGDTTAGPESCDIALLASGGLIEIVDAVLDGRADHGFALVRPPGHHAESDRVMGFCLFNQIAVAARHLQAVRGLERIAILDWDVHHGNGTQEIFYRDGSVGFASLHEYPLYPGSGRPQETGEGDGDGATRNVIFPAGAGDREVAAAMTESVLPWIREFRPDFLLVSAGFDGHRDDPLAHLRMTEEGYADLTRQVRALAEECCGGRLVLSLEGGYHLPALSGSVEAVLRELGALRDRDPGAP